MGLDTVDVDDLVKQFGEDMLRVERNAAVGSIVASSPWLAAGGPFAKIAIDMMGDIIEEILQYFNEQIGWIAFRFNTMVWSSDQGKDYISTIEKRRSMPDDVSDEDWAAIEEEANHALLNLVNYRR